MTKEYNWRIADWTDPEDYSVAAAVEDCKSIPTLNVDEPGSPFEGTSNVIQMLLKTGKRRSEVLFTKIQGNK